VQRFDISALTPASSIKASTEFSDHGGMQGWVDLVGPYLHVDHVLLSVGCVDYYQMPVAAVRFVEVDPTEDAVFRHVLQCTAVSATVYTWPL